MFKFYTAFNSIFIDTFCYKGKKYMILNLECFDLEHRTKATLDLGQHLVGIKVMGSPESGREGIARESWCEEVHEFNGLLLEMRLRLSDTVRWRAGSGEVKAGIGSALGAGALLKSSDSADDVGGLELSKSTCALWSASVIDTISLRRSIRRTFTGITVRRCWGVAGAEADADADALCGGACIGCPFAAPPFTLEIEIEIEETEEDEIDDDDGEEDDDWFLLLLDLGFFPFEDPADRGWDAFGLLDFLLVGLEGSVESAGADDTAILLELFVQGLAPDFERMVTARVVIFTNLIIKREE
ncbi:hypothetical protein J3Q64DRAFT_1824319 [Phycomyces blakesleeanus]|uniref:Uncharacterized protein n=1 Tax=Phycomyces blakesleeanus TaxID=4837 RepID=A0ABR3AQ38_PHYBL